MLVYLLKQTQLSCKANTNLNSHKELNHLIIHSKSLHFLGRNVILLHGHILSRSFDTLKDDVVIRLDMYSEMAVVIALALQ